MNLSSADLLAIRTKTVAELPDAFRALAGVGRLPLLVTFVRTLEDIDVEFVEPGMMAYLSGVDLVQKYDDGSSTYKLHLYFGDHYDHNKKLFKRIFKDDFGAQKFTALDKNKYSEYVFFTVDGSEKLSSYLNVMR